jgi:hypothetical protein
MTASLTVKKPSLLKRPKLFVTAGRTLKPQNPPLLGQVPNTGFICREIFLEI